MRTRDQLSSDEAKQVVLNLGAAINDESFQTARLYVADDMKYEGPFGTRVGAEAYLEEIERLRLKFHIQRIFADQEDVCVLYNIDTAGVTVFACGWFQIKDGKVGSLKVTFDPRPLLASPRGSRRSSHAVAGG